MSPVAHLPSVQHRFIHAGHLGIHVAELGTNGRPLVLLHGIGMDWRVWQGISRRLAGDFHLYMLDLRGHGRSDKPEHGYTLAHYAADVEDVIDSLGLHGAALIGSSLGGMVAVVVEAPSDLISHRVLVDPPITGGPVRDAASLRRILELKQEPVDELVSYLRELNPGAGAHLLRTMAQMWHKAADGVIVDALARENDYFQVDGSLRADESPTLILRADPAQGGVLQRDQAERALSLLPRGYLVDVPGAGHAVHAYKPARFAELVTDFVLRDHIVNTADRAREP